MYFFMLLLYRIDSCTFIHIYISIFSLCALSCFLFKYESQNTKEMKGKKENEFRVRDCIYERVFLR